jgi:RNA polymerase sigma-70 factor (ECF subfamily)
MAQALAIVAPDLGEVSSIEALAIRAQAGESGCFDELVRRMRPRLQRFLAGRVSTEADADDLVQETFVKALANLDRYDPRYRFSTWLFTIGSNLAASHHRSGKARAAVAPGRIAVDRVSDSVDTEASIVDREAGALLWRRAEALLKPAHYRVLWLRYAEDLDVAEIARETGRTAIAVRVLLYRARRRLAQEEL